MRLKGAAIVAPLVLIGILAPVARADLPSCEYTAAKLLRIGDGVSLDGNAAANAIGGEARLADCVFMADGTELAADIVTLGAGASVYDVLANELDLGASGEVRGTSSSVILPLSDPYCPAPSTYACGGDNVVVARGTVSGPLSPGAYRKVVLRRGATLFLDSGVYEICSLRMASASSLFVSAGPASTINVDGKVKLGNGSRLGPALNGAPPFINVGDRAVRVRNEAEVTAYVAAPDARLSLGKSVTVSGALCAASVKVGDDAVLQCVAARCGDGVLNQAGEECDAPRDGACIGACRIDCTCPDPLGPWHFTDITAAAGVSTQYAADYTGHENLAFEILVITAGVAAGDYDGDGWIDLYTVGGALGSNHLYRNRGDGSFEDQAAVAGVLLPGSIGSGPTFVDYDGDGWLDLLVGGHLLQPMSLFRNTQDGSFEDVSAASGLVAAASNFGSAFADYDGDGDLDVFIAHWGSNEFVGPLVEHLWRNNGDGSFSPATDDAELDLFDDDEFGFTWTFAPTFADLNDDGHPDLLVASDFTTEQYFLNDGDGTFTEATTIVNSSENGMGSAVADYDNDGDLDWFITSVWDPSGEAEGNWGITGNRLYRNMGGGVFEDVTDAAGVREGYWGWAACFADFNLDGHLDLMHVNGFDAGVDITAEFHDDPSRLFIADGDGTFTERSAELGLIDTGQGRGIVCFDYDRDGDIDVFISNGEGDASRLYRNDGGALGNFLHVTLQGVTPNSQAVGARVRVTLGAQTQLRELHAGNNFVSQNPVVAHFGLGTAATVDELRIEWPGGAVTTQADVAANQFLVVAHP